MIINRVGINTLALGARLPTMHAIRELVEAGGLQNGSFHAMGIARPFRCRGATMPERPFKLIKLKKTPAGSVRAFPSEISTAQAAVAFVNSLDPETRAKLHWRVAASALNGLATGQGSFDQAGRAMRHALATECWLAD